MRKLLFACLLGCAVMLSPSGVSAHAKTYYHGSDYVSVASNHHSANVCDRESDGNVFFIKILLDNGTRGTKTDWDGSAGGCAYFSHSSAIVTVQLCEQTNSWTGAHTCGGEVYV